MENINKDKINNKKMKKRNFQDNLKNFFTKLAIIIMLLVMIGFYVIQLIRGY